MAWARLTNSTFIEITHKLYLFKVFIVLFMKLLIYYLNGLDSHYCRKYTSLQLCMGIDMVLFHLLSVKSQVSCCTTVAFFFLSLAVKLHIYLCKMQFL